MHFPFGNMERRNYFFYFVLPTFTWFSPSLISAYSRIKNLCHWNTFHPNNMTKSSQPLDINTLSNFHVVEEFKQLFTCLDTEITSQMTKEMRNIPLAMLNVINVVRVRKPMDTFTEYCAIAMYSNLPQKTLHDKVEEVTTKWIALHRIKMFAEISFYLHGDANVAQTHSAQSLLFCRTTEIRLCGKCINPYWAITCWFTVNKKVLDDDLVLMGFFLLFGLGKYLFDGALNMSENAWTISNQCFYNRF